METSIGLCRVSSLLDVSRNCTLVKFVNSQLDYPTYLCHHRDPTATGDPILKIYNPIMFIGKYKKLRKENQ